MNDKTPRMSVLLVTYNHAKFIKQALDSILMQQTEFEFEIVAVDDCSTDNTLGILRRYEERHPQLRVMAAETHLGISANYHRGFKACRGEYVAVIEGDDYWISPRKLEMTANFLDRNPSCSFCFHRVIRYDPHPEAMRLFPQNWTVEQHLAVHELVESNFIGGFSTCVYRRNLIAGLRSDLWNLDIREWPFNIVMAQHGPIGYVPQVMSVYRAHEGGIWSLRSNREKAAELHRLIEAYDKFLDYKFTEQFQQMAEAAARSLQAPSRISLYWRIRIWIAQRLPPRLKQQLKRFVR
jgi:glycosyltransferase involved in cell wall biosynthesis